MRKMAGLSPVLASRAHTTDQMFTSRAVLGPGAQWETNLAIYTSGGRVLFSKLDRGSGTPHWHDLLPFSAPHKPISADPVLLTFKVANRDASLTSHVCSPHKVQ